MQNCLPDIERLSLVQKVNVNIKRQKLKPDDDRFKAHFLVAAFTNKLIN